MLFKAKKDEKCIDLRLFSDINISRKAAKGFLHIINFHLYLPGKKFQAKGVACSLISETQ
jgi:hypothetical protein